MVGHEREKGWASLSLSSISVVRHCLESGAQSNRVAAAGPEDAERVEKPPGALQSEEYKSQQKPRGSKVAKRCHGGMRETAQRLRKSCRKTTKGSLTPRIFWVCLVCSRVVQENCKTSVDVGFGDLLGFF